LAALITLPERMQLVQARMKRTVPLTLACTRCKFGRHRRLVRLLAWLTLLPTDGPLPQTSHSRAMVIPQTEFASTRCKELQRDLSLAMQLSMALAM
jgi:hypothetical protein